MADPIRPLDLFLAERIKSTSDDELTQLREALQKGFLADDPAQQSELLAMVDEDITKRGIGLTAEERLIEAPTQATQAQPVSMEVPMAPGGDLPEGFVRDKGGLPGGFVRDKPTPTSINPIVEAITRTTQGFNVGALARVPGMPADVGALAINKLLTAEVPTSLPIFGPDAGRTTIAKETGISPITEPFLGSRQLQDVGASLGFMYRDISEVPKDFRAFARAGETFGESVPFAALPFAKGAQLGTKAATGPLRAFVEPARVAPGPTALAELGAAGGASMGASLAETLAPGDPNVRMGMEVMGGIFSPISILTRTAGRIVPAVQDVASRVKQGFSPEAAELGAAQHVQDIIRLFPGENPEDLIRLLQAPPAVGAPLTAGAKSQSIGLQALEQKLRGASGTLDIKLQRDLAEAMDNINLAFREATGTGNPLALKMVAKAQRRYAIALIDTYTNVVEQQIARSRQSIVPASPTNVAVNARAKELVFEVMREARKMEKIVWNDVPKDVQLAPANTRTAFEGDVTADLLPSESIDVPKVVLKEIKRVTKEGATPTSGELIRLRSRLGIEIGREAGATRPDRDKIRRLGILREALLDDLAGLPGTDEAIQFSRDLNARFSQGYTGRVMGLNIQGGERIPEALTLEAGIASGTGPSRAVVSGELETAVTPFGRMEPGTAGVREMRELEEQIIRDMASSAIDPLTKQISPRALEQFRQSNKELLARFPELDTILADAATTTAVYGSRLKRVMAQNKDLLTKSAFARILGVEDPLAVMKSAMSGPNPTRDMDNIFLLARKDPKAMEGAKRAYLNLLFNESTIKVALVDGETTLISGAKVRELLNAGDGGVLQAARKAGVVDEGTLARIRAIADEASKVEDAMKFPGRLSRIFEDPNDLTDLLARVVGANVGSHSVLARTSGAQLVMAQAGSRLARKWIEKLPAKNITAVLEAAVRDPELMAMLIAKPVGPSQLERNANRIVAKLKKEGIIYNISEVWTQPVGFLGAAATNLTREQEQ